MKDNTRLPLNLQFFAREAGDDAGNGEGAGESGQQGNGQVSQQTEQKPAAGAIDYDKIQHMLEGTLAAKEDTALKSYFKQQGLSQEEAEQAISAFKAQKAKSQPNVAELQAQAQTAIKAAQTAKLEQAATIVAIELGIEIKTVPYLLKIADLSKAVGTDGSINNDAIKESINKVLEDVPQLKPQMTEQTGYVQIGAAGGSQQSVQKTQSTAQIATKRWNRFNN